MDRRAAAKYSAELTYQQRLEIINKSGLSFTSLIERLRDELSAKEPRFFKLKKSALDYKRKYHATKDCRVVYETDDEILISIEVVNLGIQQAARQDAHRLRRDYPTEHEARPSSGKLEELAAILRDDNEDRS